LAEEWGRKIPVHTLNKTATPKKKSKNKLKKRCCNIWTTYIEDKRRRVQIKKKEGGPRTISAHTSETEEECGKKQGASSRFCGVSGGDPT